MKNSDFGDGLKRGLPVCLAYIAVSFTFGLVTVKDGLPVWFAVLVSATNLTSAGQFAGIGLIVTGAGYLEIALAVFVINSRYILMSLSLGQRLDESVGTAKRLIMSVFVTDEIFALASMRKDKPTFAYFVGLSTLPYIGWTVGTLLGGLINSFLPEKLRLAAGIALYCMFIAIIIPPAKKSKAAAFCIAFSVALSCLFAYIPYLKEISFGFRVIIVSVAGAALCAALFPVTEAKETGV